MASPVMQLKCYCNEYPWGMKGHESIAARLAEKTPGTDFKVDENKPYSEMWFGTYPVLPSYVLETGEELQKVLDNNTNLIGEQVIKKFGHKNIPYLPKVLSIAKALPLQVHPNKDLAARLHEKNPDQFTDPNHKPEIAIALSDFEAFCGWKPLSVIQNTFATLEPLKRYLDVGGGAPHVNNETLKRIVSAMLKDSEESVKQVQEQLQAIPKAKYGSEGYILDLLPRLQNQYGKTDSGNLIALLCMNYLNLPPTSSVYIPADAPHAYLKGDIIECMARSNNVLNTGFCPRADRDSVDIFTQTLTFNPHTPEDCILPAKPFDRAGKNTTLYAPPLSEFSMLRTALSTGESETIGALGGPTMFVVTKGTGKLRAAGKESPLSEGYVFFVGQGQAMEFVGEVGGLEVYSAFVE